VIRSSKLRLPLTLLLTLITAVGLGCSPPDPADNLTQESPGFDDEQPTSSDAPSLEELASASYDGVATETVTLIGGEWEGEPFVEGGASRPVVGLVDDFYLAADLNGDGNQEAVALLWTSSGGSGTFDYLAVVGREGDRLVNLGTSELGDRVKIRAYRFENNQVVLDVIQAGPDDAGCCPGQKMQRSWALAEDGLTEVSTEDLGRISVSDLEGVEWVLNRLTWDEAAPAEPEITLVFHNGSISGSSGCNRYNSEVSEGDMPGDLSVGLIASTRMACGDDVNALETRFRQALESANQYSFMAGNLVLNWSREDVWNTMIFESRPLATESES
jgi:heat shock protein HslJ